MKRYAHLWSAITTFENLHQAYRQARQGRGGRPEVARFDCHLEPELLRLQDELLSGRYRPGSYRQFTLYERKPRLISAAPFRDRVVHHAVMNIVGPLLDRRFIDDSYACRKGRGVHRAVDRYQGWAQRSAYVLKMDISAYFPSIDHALLKQTLRLHLKDPALLHLLDLIIDASPWSSVTGGYFPGDDLLTPLERRCGIPIGNLTSQFFANLYLNRLDHQIKESLGCRAYLRYVDDMLLLSDSKATLWRWAEAIENELLQLRLRIHPRKCQLYRTALGVDVLGYQVFPGFRRLRNDNGHRFARKLRGMAAHYGVGDLTLVAVRASIASWIGHARHADSYGLRKRLLGQVCFTRD